MTEFLIDREKLEAFIREENTDADYSYIQRLFNDEKYHRELKNILVQQFNELLSSDYENDELLEKVLHTLNYNIRESKKGGNNRKTILIIDWFLRIAAILIIPVLVFASIKIFKHNSSENNTWVEIKAPSWTRVQFSLSDGTQGWLNSNSTLKYYGNFLSDRHVELQGEAFFEVTGNLKKPFVVEAGEVEIKVLGTKFNIASYSDEKNIEVVLVEGMLTFNDRDNKTNRIMAPNDMIVFDKSSGNLTSQVVQINKYMAWTEGNLVFRNDPIDEVARRLGRWYNADIELADSIDFNLRLRATFVNEGLDEVMKMLKLSLPIDYRIEEAAIGSDSIYSRKKVLIFSDRRKC